MAISEERYRISGDGRSITCCRCGMTSHNPSDVSQRYCGHCKIFHGEDAEATLRRIKVLVDVIGPFFLHGQDVIVQGTVLADLTAMWIAGHVVPGNAEGTAKMREEILKRHTELVRDLTEVNAHIINAKLKEMS